MRYISILLHFFILSGILLFSNINIDAQNVGVNKVTITFMNPPEDFAVEKAALKYNKDFAFSIHLDDGLENIYTHAFPFLQGGQISGTYYQGLKYTDGCGTDIFFKMSSAMFSFNNEFGQDVHFEGNGYYTTWSQIIEMYQNEWGIYNHALSPNYASDKYYSIARNYSYVKLKTLSATEGGIEMDIFVVPNGNVDYTTFAFDEGCIASYNEGTGPLSNPYIYYYGVDVTSISNWDTLKMRRINLISEVNLSDSVDAIAEKSVDGKHYWRSFFSHSINNGSWGYSFPNFEQNMNQIEEDYGKFGLDNVWMTTEEDILNYLIINNIVQVNTELSDNKLEITFDGELPTDLRFYSLSLIVTSDVAITSIEVDGGTSSSYNGLYSNQSLINLNWDGKIIISASENAEHYLNIAEQSQLQRDAFIAMDYIEMLPNGEEKMLFRTRLCDIPGIVFPEDYCDCEAQASDDVIICSGDCTTLSVSEGVDYIWSTGDTTQNIEVCPDSTKMYYVTVVNSVGCPASDSVKVTVNPIPDAVFSPDTIICQGDCVELSASGGVSYLWSTGDDTPEITVCPYTSNSYWIIVYNEYNCFATDTIDVEVVPYPYNILIPFQDSIICKYSCFDLIASGGDTYLWNTGDTIDTVNVCPLVETKYVVTATKYPGCSTSDSVIIGVIPSPIITHSNDTVICIGEEVILTATGADFYLWSTGSENDSIIVSPDTTTIYTVTGSLWNFCTNTDTIIVGVSPFPDAKVGPDTTICGGQCVELIASGGVDYLWNTGDTTETIITCPRDTTEYIVTVSDIYGCSKNDTAIIQVKITPELTVENLQNVYCGVTDTAHMIGIPRGGIFAGEAVVDTLFIPSLVGIGTTNVSYTFNVPNGCVLSDTILVSIFQAPEVSLGNDTTLKDNQSIILDSGSGFDTYFWSTGQTTQTILVDSSGLGLGTKDIKVFVTLDGCAVIDSIAITFKSTIGISEAFKSKSKIAIFPNPTTGIFTILFAEQLKNINIELYNNYGEIVNIHSIDNFIEKNYRKQLDYTSLPKGIYYLHFYNKEISEFKKLIIR
ncbi:MAG: T9SS type A sorting domain-containing protein [Bacteroidales bacterium]|nr:T9SS type A sorting domain-containing protein [Bacteroidales bacterium]